MTDDVNPVALRSLTPYVLRPTKRSTGHAQGPRAAEGRRWMAYDGFWPPAVIGNDPFRPIVLKNSVCGVAPNISGPQQRR